MFKTFDPHQGPWGAKWLAAARLAGRPAVATSCAARGGTVARRRAKRAVKLYTCALTADTKFQVKKIDSLFQKHPWSCTPT